MDYFGLLSDDILLSVKKKKLTWTEDVIDNEHAGKKKSNSAFRRGRVRERGSEYFA